MSPRRCAWGRSWACSWRGCAAVASGLHALHAKCPLVSGSSLVSRKAQSGLDSQQLMSADACAADPLACGDQ